MPIANSNIFARKTTEQNTERKGGSGFKYPVLRAGQQQLQLLRIEDFEDTKFGKPEYNNMKLRFLFVLLVPGADEAETAEEQTRFRNKGHGKYFSLEVNPICSPPGKNRKTQATISPSGLYELLRVMVNDGEPLTPEQLGLDEETRKLPAAQRAEVAGQRLTDMLTALEQSKPQVYGTLVQKVNAAGTKYNRLQAIVSVVDADDRLPEYQPYARPVDPREADDDPNVVCSVTGEPLRGWENRDGEWVSNVEWAKMQREFFDDFAYELDGNAYHAPFGPKHYRSAREQFETEEVPF